MLLRQEGVDVPSGGAYVVIEFRDIGHQLDAGGEVEE